MQQMLAKTDKQGHEVCTAVERVINEQGDAKNLTGSGYDTDKDWHALTMRYGEGWARDPTYSQYQRAKPPYTDPEDDMTHLCRGRMKNWRVGRQLGPEHVSSRRGENIISRP